MNDHTAEADPAARPSNFIRSQLLEERRLGLIGEVVTRFPPEPNGYLHIGHAKSICLNFALAADFGGRCHLRMDDTNPEKESVEYAEAIKDAVHWLGFDWGEHLYYASDYYERLYDFAVALIRAGKAYVDDLTAEQMREYRGSLTEAGKESFFRERSVAENLDLFARMRAGEFADGARTLRGKIDMASANMNMRDPVLYRIQRVPHYRTGDRWCIYPMYDFAHPLSDAIEGVSHSICTLEFEDHRPLYDWVLDNVSCDARPRQIEFARLNLAYTVMSKRRLLELVRAQLVQGWDDPRMPTLVGMRRRGYPPEAIRTFCERIGVGKNDSLIDMEVLEECVRETLNQQAPRVMGVLRPLRVILDNYPAELIEEFEAQNHPQDPAMGSRKVPFSRELYIDRDDFREEAPKGFFRLAPGREVRLRYAYIIRCERVEKDEHGEIDVLHCTVDHDSRGGSAADGRKIKGTIHWVSAAHALRAEVRLYDRLFKVPQVAAEWQQQLNPDSLQILTDCRLEPSLAAALPGTRFQFERQGYFCRDEAADGVPTFNRTATLRSSWTAEI